MTIVQTESTIPNLQFKITSLSKFQVEGTDHKNAMKARMNTGGKWMSVSKRFWTSFFARFGISDSIFRYYTHQEVFDRIRSVKGDVQLRLCTDGSNALAISNPEKSVLMTDDFRQLAQKFQGEDLQYQCGIVTSIYTPNSGEHKSKIGPDNFRNRYMLEAPLDGYGKPSIYLSMLREVCTNGIIAYTTAFRTDIAVGNDPKHNLNRALESFDSDEGYSALRQRFETSQLSPASLYECLKLYKLLKKMERTDAISTFDKVAGNIYDQYGVANLDAISEKKLHLLPAKCRVYDLINLVSELSTHHTNDSTESMKLNAWIGTTLSREYDLEGTNTKRIDFAGKHFSN